MSVTAPSQTRPGTADPQATQSALDAARATAAALPSAEPLTVGQPVAGSADIAEAFGEDGLAGAAVAHLEGPGVGSVAVLVGADLVAALSNSPLGALDLAAAVQPALDAAARALGRRAGAVRTVDVADVTAELGGQYTAVPLVGSSTSAAVLVTDSALLRTAEPTGDGDRRADPVTPRGMEMLHGVVLDVTVELGRTRMTVRELLSLSRGTVLELDRAAGSPADLLVNGRVVARGEVVVVDEDFGLRVTEIVPAPEQT